MTTPTQLVSGTDFVCVATRDLAAARRFYGEVLGLRPSTVWQRPGAPAAIDSGVCLQAHFADPDGNTLGIHHRYAPRG